MHGYTVANGNVFAYIHGQSTTNMWDSSGKWSRVEYHAMNALRGNGRFQYSGSTILWCLYSMWQV